MSCWFCFFLWFLLPNRLLSGPALVLPVSFWHKLVFPIPRLPPVTPVPIMDNPHGREIHYHVARALMHSNCIAGFLPFCEPAVDWDDQLYDPYGRSPRVHPHHRQLHTFVPLLSSSSIRALTSHGGLPTHMVLNPEPHLRPLSIRRETNPIEDHLSNSNPVKMEPPSSTSGRAPGPPANPVPNLLDHARAKESPADDARPKKKQRAIGTTTSSTTTTIPPTLPVIRDIPPEGFNSDDSDDDTYPRHSPCNPRPISPPPVNPSAPVTGPPRPPTVEDHSTPAVPKSGTTATPAVTPVVPPWSSVRSNFRPSRTLHIQKWHTPDPGHHGRQSASGWNVIWKYAGSDGKPGSRPCPRWTLAPNRKRKLRTKPSAGGKKCFLCVLRQLSDSLMYCFISTSLSFSQLRISSCLLKSGSISS